MSNLKENEVAVRILSQEEVVSLNISVDNNSVAVKVEETGSSVDKNKKGRIKIMTKKFLETRENRDENGITIFVVPDFLDISSNDNNICMRW